MRTNSALHENLAQCYERLKGKHFLVELIPSISAKLVLLSNSPNTNRIRFHFLIVEHIIS